MEGVPCPTPQISDKMCLTGLEFRLRPFLTTNVIFSHTVLFLEDELGTSVLFDGHTKFERSLNGT